MACLAAAAASFATVLTCSLLMLHTARAAMATRCRVAAEPVAAAAGRLRTDEKRHTMTTTFLRAATAPHDHAATVTTAILVDHVSGPHTIVALGEDCLVCEEGPEPGPVHVFCRDATGSGVAHESCTDTPTLALPQ